MRYSIVFFALGVLCIWSGVAFARTRHPAWLLLAWAGMSFVMVGIAYLGTGPRIFGKRPDGSLPRGRSLLLLPFFSLLWATWHLSRMLRSEAPYCELIPGVKIGRRLLVHEYPPGLDTILDLTCEFAATRGIDASIRYVSFPILDASVPDSDALLRLVRGLRNRRGDLYIHCAEGHGRSGMVAAVLLLIEGHAAEPSEAIRLIHSQRPLAKLNKRQRRLVSEISDRLAVSAIEG